MQEHRFEKVEKIQLNPKYETLIKALERKSSLFDERLVRELGKEVGFISNDHKVYRLLSAYHESIIDQMLTSINHKNGRDIEMITKKVKDAKKDPSGDLYRLFRGFRYRINYWVLNIEYEGS